MMDNFIKIIFYFLSINALVAQSGSYLYAIPDTVTPQGFTLSIHNDRIFALNSTFQVGVFTGLNFVPYLEEYSLNGERLKKILVDPIFPQGYAVINNLPILWLGDTVLIAADKSPISIDDPQHAIVWGFAPEGTNLWTQPFSQDNFLGTSGILLKANGNKAFHANIRSAQDTEADDLEVSLIHADGEVEFTKNIPLPMDIQRNYIRVMGGASLKDKFMVLSIYGLGGGGNTKSMLTVFDTLGNVIEFKDLVSSLPNIASRVQSDTFYLSKYKIFGNHEYYCLETYIGGTSNLISTKCTDVASATSNDYIRNLRVDSKGNAYSVGTTFSQSNTVAMAHVVKWSSTGNLLWKKKYELPEYVGEPCVFNDINFLSDGKLVLSGFAHYHEWLLILDENGCYNGDCGDIITLPSTIVSNKEIPNIEMGGFNIYPNPTNAEINIEFPSAGNLRLFDSQGSLWIDKTVNQGKISFSVDNYPRGCYFAQFIDENNLQTILKKVIFLGKE
jgi:hypothetical protein